MPTAFILGAGLGTRLRPLTNRWPKPLVPVAHDPLILWAMRHLRSDLSIDRFIVNTHHLASAYADVFPNNSWHDLPVIFRHEPVLLDTGGGLANIRDLLADDEPLAIYNGDILCDAPLAPLRAAHLASNAAATLLLRSGGPLCNVTCTPDGQSAGGHPCGPIRDLRGITGASGPRYQFTGICIVSPQFIRNLPPKGNIFSIIQSFVSCLQRGDRITGVIIDDNHWSDLGTPDAFLDTHAMLAAQPFPRYAPADIPRIHPTADIAPGSLDALSWAGPGVVVPAGCQVSRSVLLADTHLPAGSRIDRQIPCHG